MTSLVPDSVPVKPHSGRPVFQARGVTKVYDMGEVQVHALRGVDLELFPAELVVLLGPPDRANRRS